MNCDLLSIETAQNKSLKDQIKVRLGCVFSFFFSGRTKQLVASPTSYPLGLRDKMLMAFLRERARTANDSSFIERLHADFWRGTMGSVFSKNCDHRFEDLFLGKQTRDIEQLLSTWSHLGCKHIVEIGCCSGKHLQFLTTTLPNVESAVGIDINPHQIETNINSQSLDPRISFYCTDGAAWILENAKPRTLFVTNGGVLEYFRRERLDELLCHIKKNLEPALFFTVEPVAPDYDSIETLKSIPFGDELTFSHNYRHLYESNGFSVLHQRPVDFDLWRMMTTIAVG